MKIEGKHLVLGNGHLSKELQDMLRKHGIDYEVAGRDILSYPEKVPYKEYFEQFGMIWNCIGHGSVGGDSQKQIMAHVGLVDFLLNMDIYQIHFSSNYAQRPEQSFYAMTKALGEDVLYNKNNPKSLMVRVANLCGEDYGISYKLARAIATQKIVDVVTNYVSPTDTKTLADCLVQNYERFLEERLSGKLTMFKSIYSPKIPVCELAMRIVDMIKEMNPNFQEPEFRLRKDSQRPMDYNDADIEIKYPHLDQVTIAKALI